LGVLSFEITTRRIRLDVLKEGLLNVETGPSRAVFGLVRWLTEPPALLAYLEDKPPPSARYR
jgi:hypothetical protein